MRWAVRVLGTGWLVGAIAGCSGAKPVAAAPKSAQDPAQPASPPQAVNPTTAVTRAAELLPAKTQLWTEVRSIRRLAEILERERFESRMPTEYDAVAATFRGAFGVDVLDPDNLPRLGLDPDGEMGFFVLEEDGTLGFYARMNDMNVVRESIIALTETANASVRPESIAGAEVFRDKYTNFGVVLRQPFVVLVGRGRGDEGTTDWLRAVATQEPAASLASRSEFKTVFESARDDEDVRAYVNPSVVAGGLIAKLDRQQEFDNWADQELERARKDGAPPERIAELEKQRADNEEFARRFRQRRVAESDLLRLLFSGMSAIGMQANMKTRGPMGQARVVAGDQELLRKVFRNRQGPPLLPTVLGGRPMFIFEASTEPEHLRELADRFLRTENQTFDKLMIRLEEETNIPFGGRVWPMLTGQGGVAITLDAEPDYGNPDSLQKALGLTAYLEVLDPDKAKAELDGAMSAAKIDGAKFVKDRKTDMWSFHLVRDGKKTWRRVYVAVAGRNLVITTDASVVGRISKGIAGSGATTAPDGSMAAVGRADQALVYASDGAVIGWLTIGFYTASSAVALAESAQDAKVAFSRRYKKKKKQLEAVQVRLDTLERRSQAKAVKASFALAEAFGMTVWTAAEVDEGFVMDIGQYMRTRSLVELAELALAVSSAGRDQNDPDVQLRDDLWRERDRLSGELRQIRDEDLERAR